ncbi:flavin reductase family protein [soil metagenome]
MHIDPAHLAPPDRYKLLIGGIVPRPIALVSTITTGKTFVTVADAAHVNIAPFSFFAGVGSNPMTLLFCPANTAEGGEKDSLRNAKPVSEGGQGEFVVNIAPARIVRQLAACAEPLPYGESEAALSGLTPIASSVVGPPRVSECGVAFECRTQQVIRTQAGASSAGNIVIGLVVAVHVDDALINDRLHIDPELLDAVARMGGMTYCSTRERFDLPAGRGALEKAQPIPAEPQRGTQ